VETVLQLDALTPIAPRKGREGLFAAGTRADHPRMSAANDKRRRLTMAKKQSTLGKDFYSILDDNIMGMKDGAATTLRISEIEPRSDQPRKQFDREALEALADSIAAYGVLQPLLVRQNLNFEGTYEIIAGERRWRAAKMAGLVEMPVIILDGDDLKTAQIALIENVQRENLNVVEEAFGYRALMERFDMTQEEVAKQVGKSRPAITNILRLLDLPDEVLQRYGFQRVSGGRTDVVALRERGLSKDCCNISCGYYNAHKTDEYTIFPELQNTLALVTEIVGCL
jgi:ParB/RepB/Spo0J family partition protein